MLRLISKLVTVTPVTDTSIYASGDQIGTAPSEAQVFKFPISQGLLQSLTLVDKASQKSALDLFFFDTLPAFVSSQNAAFDITDATAVASLIGTVTVATTDYKDTASNSVATVRNIGLLLRSNTTPTPVQNYGSVWVGFVARGTPTYTSASDLVLKLLVQGY